MLKTKQTESEMWRCKTLSVVLLLTVFSGGTLGQDCGPTPSEFEEQYIEICRNPPFAFSQSTCTSALDAFKRAVSPDPPAVVTPSSYDPYYAIFPLEAGRDETLFWTRTNQLVDLVSMMMASGNIVSSFNVPSTGIIKDIGSDISWCGDASSPGSLDLTNMCDCNATTSFFVKLSNDLALATTGTFFFLGNGETQGGTFRNNSFFAREELPHLASPRVSRGIVMNVHRMGIGEACGQGSLCELQERIEDKGFSYVCYNIYGDVNDPSQTAALGQCANGIIAAEQQGREPDPNNCYSLGGGVGVISTGWLVLLLLLAVPTLAAL